MAKLTPSLCLLSSSPSPGWVGCEVLEVRTLSLRGGVQMYRKLTCICIYHLPPSKKELNYSFHCEWMRTHTSEADKIKGKLILEGAFSRCRLLLSRFSLTLWVILLPAGVYEINRACFDGIVTVSLECNGAKLASMLRYTLAWKESRFFVLINIEWIFFGCQFYQHRYWLQAKFWNKIPLKNIFFCIYLHIAKIHLF